MLNALNANGDTTRNVGSYPNRYGTSSAIESMMLSRSSCTSNSICLVCAGMRLKVSAVWNGFTPRISCVAGSTIQSRRSTLNGIDDVIDNVSGAVLIERTTSAPSSCTYGVTADTLTFAFTGSTPASVVHSTESCPAVRVMMFSTTASGSLVPLSANRTAVACGRILRKRNVIGWFRVTMNAESKCGEVTNSPGAGTMMIG